MGLWLPLLGAYNRAWKVRQCHTPMTLATQKFRSNLSNRVGETPCHSPLMIRGTVFTVSAGSQACTVEEMEGDIVA